MIIVIFGASGDLAKRKLFPSLTSIDLNNTKIIGYSRADLRSTFNDKLKEYNSYNNDFLDKIEYISGQYDDLSELYRYIDEEILFYFSLPPKVYKTLLDSLKYFKKGKIAIEKPFGNNMLNFIEIEDFINKNPAFEIYLVDHYLLKPICIALPSLKINTKYFKGLLNNKYISAIEIISNEQLGIEGRSYFDDTGIVKDILQNHLIEFFCTVFGEYSNANTQLEIANARMKIINNLEVDEDKNLFGQYKGYINELGKDSVTETYAFFMIKNNQKEFKDIPIMMYGGKGLDKKRTEIKVSFKKEHFKFIIESVLSEKCDNNEQFVLEKDIESVEVVFNMAPDNQIVFRVSVKEQVFDYKIISTEEIKNITAKAWGSLSDHSLIFDSFLKNKDFPATKLEEARREWEIFNGANKNPKRIFYYDKGVEIPNEVAHLINQSKEHN